MVIKTQAFYSLQKGNQQKAQWPFEEQNPLVYLEIHGRLQMQEPLILGKI